jgi:hypothetical protein
LDKANCLRANFKRADLEKAALDETRLEEASLQGSNLHRSSVQEANLLYAIIYEPGFAQTILPDGRIADDENHLGDLTCLSEDDKTLFVRLTGKRIAIVLRNSPDHYQVFRKDGPFKAEVIEAERFHVAAGALTVWFREADYPSPVVGHVPRELKEIIAYFHHNRNLADITVMVYPATTEFYEYDEWSWVPVFRYFYGWESCDVVNEYDLMTLVFKQVARLSELMDQHLFFDSAYDPSNIDF